MKNDSEVVFEEEIRNTDIEVITIQDGWLGLTSGYFCLIERNSICVEDFGLTRRSALRLARRAWKKEKGKKIQKEGYPQVRRCS